MDQGRNFSAESSMAINDTQQTHIWSEWRDTVKGQAHSSMAPCIWLCEWKCFAAILFANSCQRITCVKRVSKWVFSLFQSFVLFDLFCHPLFSFEIITFVAGWKCGIGCTSVSSAPPRPTDQGRQAGSVKLHLVEYERNMFHVSDQWS